VNDQQLQTGLKVAKEAQARSYSPYSKFSVGAALKLKGRDLWIPGCNVENASFGGTVCAERIAVFSAISQHDCREFEAIIVLTNSPKGDLPCAFCLQVLSEFVGPDFPVYSAGPTGVMKSYRFKELLPHPFDKLNLPDA
jgi:cytidine deaminase